jgi:hypothetical protein
VPAPSARSRPVPPRPVLLSSKPPRARARPGPSLLSPASSQAARRASPPSTPSYPVPPLEPRAGISCFCTGLRAAGSLTFAELASKPPPCPANPSATSAPPDPLVCIPVNCLQPPPRSRTSDRRARAAGPCGCSPCCWCNGFHTPATAPGGMQQRVLCSSDRFDRFARERPAVIISTSIHPSVFHAQSCLILQLLLSPKLIRTCAPPHAAERCCCCFGGSRRLARLVYASQLPV